MADQLMITGKYLGAGKIETVGDKGYTKRKFWVDITTNEQYPDTPEFELGGDKVNLVDHLKPGDTVQVKFNLRGRKVMSKTLNREVVINNVLAWKIDVVTMQSAAVPRAPSAVAAFTGEDTGDDLPF